VHLQICEQGIVTNLSRHRLAAMFQALKSSLGERAVDGAVTPLLTGTERGIIVLRCKLVVGDSVVEAGRAMATQLQTTSLAARDAYDGVGAHSQESLKLLSKSTFTHDLQEPYASPSSNLGLALHVNETVRNMMKGRSVAADPCRNCCAAQTSVMSEPPSNLVAVDEADRPQSILPIVDVSVEFLEEPLAPAERLVKRRDASFRSVALTLTVGGDSPTRVVEVAETLIDEQIRLRAESGAQAKEQAAECVTEELAVLLCAAARASELNDIATATTAGHTISAIASSKRITKNDLNIRLNLTLYNVYRVGVSNVPRSYETTSWSGAYPAGFDIGSSSGIGKDASSWNADKRHVPCPSVVPPVPSVPSVPRIAHTPGAQESRQDNDEPGMRRRVVRLSLQGVVHAGLGHEL